MQALDACVAERGEDYVYPEAGKVDGICQYWWEGPSDEDEDGKSLPEGPGCIVGLALSKLGVSDQFIQDLTLMNAQNALNLLAKRGSWQIEEGAAGLFRYAQIKQDAGWSWGYAAEQAKLHYETTVGL